MNVFDFQRAAALGLLMLAALAGPACPADDSGAVAAGMPQRPGTEWNSGLIMGYNYGQNGMPWTKPLTDPLGNNNRGGFYILQTRIQAVVHFDSTFLAMAVANPIQLDVQDVFLQKTWGEYTFKAGKFRGAGLKSGSGMDEFELTTARKPYYARVWSFYKKTFNYRDFGIQAEKSFFSGRMFNRLFIHNANGENVLNDEPSGNVGPVTQVTGIDYAVDVRVSPYTMVGGHLGALANREWDEFLGSHEGWQAQYWLKSNPLVDASFYHHMTFPRFHMENEALIMQNRMLLKADSSATLSWGVSTLSRFDHFRHWSPFFAYEFTDQTDGYTPNDAVQMFKLGTLFRPAPERYPSLRITGEYVRALEEGARDLVGNDILYAQFQMVF